MPYSTKKKRKEWLNKNKSKRNESNRKRYASDFAYREKLKEKARSKARVRTPKQRMLENERYRVKYHSNEEFRKIKIARAKKQRKTLSTFFSIYKRNAKVKKLMFELSFLEFEKITNQKCWYCGKQDTRRGIDRIDNTKGYTLSNSVASCSVCNYMKKEMLQDKFLEHCKIIVEQHKV